MAHTQLWCYFLSRCLVGVSSFVPWKHPKLARQLDSDFSIRIFLVNKWDNDFLQKLEWLLSIAKMFFIYTQAKTIGKINFWQALCSFSVKARQGRAIQSFSKSCSDWSFIRAARNWNVLYILLGQSWLPCRNILWGCLIRIDYQRMRNVVFLDFLYYLMHKNQFNFFAGFVRYWYFSRCCHPSNKSHSPEMALSPWGIDCDSL